MEILIYDIPEQGLTRSFSAEKDAWFSALLKAALGDAYDSETKATLDVTFLRFGDDVDMSGELRVVSWPTCDRCLNRYREEVTLPVHIHMAPLYESKRQMAREHEEGADTSLVKEDLEFSYYEGDRIHLDEIVNELVVLMQPMKHPCREDCRGLCQKCGKDLNEGPCSCAEERSDARWNALKEFKPSKR